MILDETTLRLAHEIWQKASLAYHEAEKAKMPGRYSLLIARRKAEVDLDALQKMCLAEFARSRGWKVKKNNGITLQRLLAGRMLGDSLDRSGCHPEIDHRECFMFDRRPKAILSHTYASWDRCLGFALEHGLYAEQLPFSWYYPGGTIAVLFTRQAV